MIKKQKKQQRGGTILGFIIGAMVGLGAALAVALYVTKVPVPFVNKGATRAADQDVIETNKNKDWDPNAALAGKNPARAPVAAASGPVTGAAPAVAAVAKPSATDSSPSRTASPAAPAKAERVEPRTADAKPADGKPATASNDPLGDLARAKSAATAVDPFDYFVQAGAFRSTEEAEAQRAKLAMMGWQAKVTEREQSGRTVFRVRVGPFGKKDDAEGIKEKFESSGVESALVRVQR